MRRWVVVVGLLVAGCGPDPLAGIGTPSAEWLADVPPPLAISVPVTTPAPPQVADLTDVDWFSGEDTSPPTGEPSDVIDSVWQATSGSDRYVQAPPGQIAAALPGVAFPASVPAAVESITSQLVFDPKTGGLDPAELAAFGLWETEPYTRDRSSARAAVLRVSRAPVSTPVSLSGPAPAACPIPNLSSCVATVVDGTRVWESESSQELILVWDRGEYRYLLTLDDHVDPRLGHLMVGAMQPLMATLGSTGVE